MNESSLISSKEIFKELPSISETPIGFRCNHLTYAEQERIAYVAGHGVLASTPADASDLEAEVDLFDAILDRAK